MSSHLDPPFVLAYIFGLAQVKPQDDQESINLEGQGPLQLGCAGIATNMAPLMHHACGLFPVV